MTVRVPTIISALALLVAPGCLLFDDDRPTDGEVCRSDDDCNGACTPSNLCAHSRCECPSGNCAPAGEQSSACREGWACFRHNSLFDPVQEFFGGTPDRSKGYCRPLCEAGCPEHYTCSGDFCTPDDFWAYPVPTITWAGGMSGPLSEGDEPTTIIAEEGSTMVFTGSASSPIGDPIVALRWTLTSAAETSTFEGETLELAVSSVSVTIEAEDAQGRTGGAIVFLAPCKSSGSTCDHQGSACCNGCENDSNTCQ